MAEHDASVARGAAEFAVDGLAAADRLDARRALGEIIDRLMERHAVGGDPLHRGGSLRGERGEVVLVALEFGRLQHVVHERRLDAIDRGHAHVGRRPAGVAAGIGFGGFVDEGDGDGEVFRPRCFGGGKRGGQAGSALADDDDVFGCCAHSVARRSFERSSPLVGEGAERRERRAKRG